VLHQQFLSIVSKIEGHARIYFRGIKCFFRKQDYISECIALAWKWFVALAKRGKDARLFPTALASFAARAVRSGRRLCGQLKARDALSETTQQRHHFYVSKLPDHATLSDNPLAEALHDNTRTPPPDAAAFRCDFPAWLRTQSHRHRRIIRAMAMGHRTRDLAQTFGCSPTRISQLRAQYREDWQRFTEEPDVRAG
jgi:hypothetical protein